MPIYDGKNMDLVDWLLQTENVVLLTNSKEFELAIVKPTSTPYKILKRMGEVRSWHEIRNK